MKKRFIALLCVIALRLSVLTACQKPDNSEGNADNGGTGDNGTVEDSGNIKDDDNTSKPRESITSLLYTGEGVRTSFGYHYYGYKEIICDAGPPKNYSSHIDYEAEYSYYPVNDVKIKVSQGTTDKSLKTHKLAITDENGKLIKYLTEPDDWFRDEKYSVIANEDPSPCTCTSSFCMGYYHLTYSYSEEVVIPEEFFTEYSGYYGLCVYASGNETGCVTRIKKIYYHRYGDIIRISAKEIDTPPTLITKESDVSGMNLKKDIAYGSNHNTEHVGSIVAYKVMLEANNEREGVRGKIFVALKCDDSRYLVALYNLGGRRYLRGFSFEYSVELSFSFSSTYAAVYMWDRALSFSWNSEDHTMGDPREIVDYLENDDIRETLNTLSAKTEAKEYTAELSGNSGAYNKLTVKTDENTAVLDFAQKSE